MARKAWKIRNCMTESSICNYPIINRKFSWVFPTFNCNSDRKTRAKKTLQKPHPKPTEVTFVKSQVRALKCKADSRKLSSKLFNCFPGKKI